MPEYIADLHIHSHYSRATSKDLTFEHLARWAQLKGVHIVGTGDMSHPGWLAEMREKLTPAEPGLYRLKDDVAAAVQEQVPPVCHAPVRFLLTGEISNIYKRHDAVRKVHNVIFAPDLETVARIQTELEKIGNIRSDGRPILGLDSYDLFQIVLDIDPRCYLIPAHIWTPWFSMLGSKSGFNSVEECFGDLAPRIFALETGLSSDPPMNWRVSNLDGYTLVSNSDAHSPQKLAREATVFHTELTYDALFAAMQSGDPAQFGGTLEFFPEEGKYHLDGHRKCGVCWEPPTTLSHDGRCPVCGKPVTVGVMHRVERLADRPPGGKPARTHPFASLVPLPEILAEIYAVGAGSKRVRQAYEGLLANLGPELVILRHLPLEEIAAAGGESLATAIGHIRKGEVIAQGGYDGEYGVVRVFAGAAADAPQLDLFGDKHGAPKGSDPTDGDPQGGPELDEPGLGPQANMGPDEASGAAASEAPVQRVRRAAADTAGDTDTDDADHTDLGDTDTVDADAGPATITGEQAPNYAEDLFHGQTAISVDETGEPFDAGAAAGAAHTPWLERLNAEQRAAVECVDAPLVILAGPGTGKTRTLTVRIAHLLQTRRATPASILAITFTNKAAEEMRTRLVGLVGEATAAHLTISTFHALGAQLLREYGAALGLSPDFAIADDADRLLIMRQALPDASEQASAAYLNAISTAKSRLLGPDAAELGEIVGDTRHDDKRHDPTALADAYRRYTAALADAGMVDFDDLILLAVRLLRDHPTVAAQLHDRYGWISVDEYQDVNYAQVRLLQLLAAGGANVCVIGDPDQAIYGFRGADHRFFQHFQAEVPQAVTVRLRQSYRSPQSLLDAAAQVIEHNPDRAAQTLWSSFTQEVKLDIVPTPTERAEAETVVHTIEQMVGGTSYFSLDSGRVAGTEETARNFGDFAVLYRLNAQSRALVEAFERSGIPYQVVGRRALRDEREIRALLALLRLRTQNTGLRPALMTLLGTGSGALALAEITQLAAAVAAKGMAPALAALLDTGALNPAQRRRIQGLADLWEKWPAAQELAELIPGLFDAWCAWQQETPSQAQKEHVHRLVQRAASFGRDATGFLQALALQSSADLYDPRAECVTLCTLHAAKGLEFPVAFMVGCEEGLLPYAPLKGRTDGADDAPSPDGAKRADTDPAEPDAIEPDTAGVASPAMETAATQDMLNLPQTERIEEERRLFYVGMTRAQERLLLLHAQRRRLFGERLQQPVSRFVQEIEAALKTVQAREAPPPKRTRQEDLQLKLF